MDFIAPVSQHGTHHPILSAETQARLDQLCGTPQHTGNSITLLASGAASYEYRWRVIEQAKTSIHIVAFSLMLDDTSRRLRDLLLKKLQQGVEVKLIFDDAVMWSTFSGPLVSDLTRAGAKAVRYHKLFRDFLPSIQQGNVFKQIVHIFKRKLKRRFHEKYMIIDGTEVILGGINWGNKYAFGGIEPKAWRDSDTYITGPVVADIQLQFHKDFDRYQTLDHYLSQSLDSAIPDLKQVHPIPEQVVTGKDTVRYVVHKPYDDNQLVLTNAYLLMIKQAQHYIDWGCHGIRPPRVLAEALIEAVQRGVEVRLFTNSQHASRTLMMRGLLGWMYWESQLHFHYLLKHGVKIYEWQKPGAFHSKNMVIDDIFASVGSYNIARGSAFHHTESNIFVTEGAFPLAVRQQFNLDSQDCKAILLADVKPPSKANDPYLRPLSERTHLVADDLLPTQVKKDLYDGKSKR